MTDIAIPPAALEAGARAIADVEYPRLPPRNEHYEMARAACLAMFEAWPGMRIKMDQHNGPDIVLPLPPQENPDAEA